MKIYLEGGHQIVNGKGTGAHSDFGDEAVLAKKFIIDAAKYLWSKYKIMLYTDDNNWSLSETIIKFAEKTEAGDILISVHFDAFNGQFNGATAYIAKENNAKEQELAADLLKVINTATGIRNRGIKTEDQSQHNRLGILSGKASDCTNVLIELCFIDNASDMKKFNDNYEVLYKAFAEVLKKHYI